MRYVAEKASLTLKDAVTLDAWVRGGGADVGRSEIDEGESRNNYDLIENGNADYRILPRYSSTSPLLSPIHQSDANFRLNPKNNLPELGTIESTRSLICKLLPNGTAD